jgi:hypothetical protein
MRRSERGNKCDPRNNPLATLAEVLQVSPTDNPSIPEVATSYLGYFHCFNRGLYFEAHEVLEKIWLPDRKGPDAAFYKGLIQLAGAFVHLQKNRAVPAASLFKLAQANLKLYPDIHHSLDLRDVLRLVQSWLDRLEHDPVGGGYLTGKEAPRIMLLAQNRASGAN